MKQKLSRSKFFAIVSVVVILLLSFYVIINRPFDPPKESEVLFQAVEPETTVEGTKYLLEYTNQNLVLKNQYTQKSITVIQGYSPVAAPPAYALVRTNSGGVYLITRLASGGNSGAYWFKVFDVRWSFTEDLIAKSGNPNQGQSCTNPVLAGSVLRFEIAPNCSANPSDASSGFQTYRLYLVSNSAPSPTAILGQVTVHGRVQGGG